VTARAAFSEAAGDDAAAWDMAAATAEVQPEQVRRTVIHEVARHFGVDDARLDELGW
jgi:predicted Zn-dependent protease with MMP-like domain